MFFGEISVQESVGSYLAHSLKTSTGKLRKGQQLTQAMVRQLEDDGITQVVVAQLHPGDVHEDEAALQLATAIAGPGIRLGKAITGRVNLHALGDGVCVFERDLIDKANQVDEGITIATVHPSSAVGKGRLVATVKIIPYAVSRDSLQRVLAGLHSRMQVHTSRIHRAILVQTRLPGLKASVLDKTVEVTRQRLLSHGAELMGEYRVDHAVDTLAATMKDAIGRGVDWLLIAGASAIADRRDVIPSAIIQLGGEVQHYGMPMDPGNLVMMGTVGSTRVVGMPGCARSPRPNGVDKILERLACGLTVDSGWIATLGVGGLLHEIVDRPQPRVPQSGKLPVAALVLAAGSSRRFGPDNKLLATRASRPLLSHVLGSVKLSEVDRILLVTGHDATAVSTLCEHVNQEEGTRVAQRHNPLHASGMASSLICGIADLSEQGADAVLVCLGDMPDVNASTMNALVRAFRENPDKALYIPTFDGQRGNPVLIAASLFDSVLMLEGDVGARVLARQFPDSVREVPCDSPAVLVDIDELSDL